VFWLVCWRPRRFGPTTALDWLLNFQVLSCFRSRHTHSPVPGTDKETQRERSLDAVFIIGFFLLSVARWRPTFGLRPNLGWNADEMLAMKGQHEKGSTNASRSESVQAQRPISWLLLLMMSLSVGLQAIYYAPHDTHQYVIHLLALHPWSIGFALQRTADCAQLHCALCSSFTLQSIKWTIEPH